jgi:hypothetical protein
MLLWRRRWHIEGRTSIEETHRLEQETTVGHGHHRKIFGAGDVMIAKGIPNYNISVI